MSDSLNYLSYLINEDIYIIDETTTSVKPNAAIDSKEKVFYNVVVLLHEKPTTEEQNFLQKVLQSVGLSMDDVRLIHQQEFLSGAKEQFESIEFKHLLAFGAEQNAVETKVRYEAIQKDKKHYLFADKLRTISEDKVLKQQLWSALKKMFSVVA